MTDHLAIMREHVAALVAADCPVCASPRRLEIDYAIYERYAWDNQTIALQFGIGDGGQTGGEIVRQHRGQGHVPPRDEVLAAWNLAGRPWSPAAVRP